jgi:uncharacterized repeat protein (TIGR01451 family)
MDLRTRAALAAVILSISMTASAGVNTWSTLGPNGGEVQKVVYNRDTPATVYMIAAAGFLRSLDAGATWQLVKNDFYNRPTDLDVDPTDPTRVYVVATDRPHLLVSTDAGATFTPVTSFPDVENAWQLEVGADGKTLYATSGMRVFRSQDRAETWQERTALGTTAGVIFRMLVDPTNKDVVYASASFVPSTVGMFVTRDGAATWTKLTGDAPPGYVYDIAISAANPTRIWVAAQYGVYVSSDSGLHFSASFSPPGTSTGAAYAVAINPADPTNLFVAAPYGGVFRTTNEGASWAEVTGDVTAGQPATIALRPMQPTPHVLVGGRGGLSLSTTGGMNWTPRETGFIGANISSLSADPTSDRVYLSVQGGGVHYVAGGTGTTTPVDNVKLRQQSATPNTFTVPAVLAQDGASSRLFASLDTRIAQSLDGGNSWGLTGFPTQPATQAISLTSSPVDPQVILAGTHSSLYRSADGGNSWAPATTGLPTNAYVEQVAFSASDPQIAYAIPNVYTPASGGGGQSFGVYRSANAGLTWSAANTGIETLGVVALAVDPTDAQTVYASGNSKLWRSTNGGNSWTDLTTWQSQTWGYPSAIAVDPLHPQILYVGAQLAVARSINRGETWELLREARALPLWLPKTVLPDPLRPHVLLVGTQQSGVQQISIAPDLKLDLDAPAATLPVGVPVTYRYTVLNLGPFHATGVKVSLQAPANAQAVTLESSAGTCTAPGPTMSCSFDALRAGFDATVTLKATPSAVGSFQIAATAQADQPDSAAGNNTQTRDATIAQLADLSVTATGTASAQVGSTVTHTITVSNAGPNAATAVQLGYQLASTLTPGAVTTTVGTCSVSAPQISCNLGDMATSTAATITVTATAATVGAQPSTASFTTTATDTAVANNVATVNTNVTAAPPANPPPSSDGGGGGGSLSASWLFFLALMLAWQSLRDAQNRPRRRVEGG